MRDMTPSEQDLLLSVKKGLIGVKSDLTKLKALALANEDWPVLLAAQKLHAEIDRAHSDAGAAAYSMFSNASTVLKGPGR